MNFSIRRSIERPGGVVEGPGSPGDGGPHTRTDTREDQLEVWRRARKFMSNRGSEGINGTASESG